MLHTTVVALLLAAPGPDPHEYDVATASIHISEQGAEVLAYDAHETLNGSILVVPQGNGVTIAVDFDDGYFDIVVDDAGEVSVIKSNLTTDTIEQRLEAIGLALEIGSPPQEGKFTCFAAAGGAVLGCARLALWCPIAILATICTCGELADPTHVECP
ncbi:hypothetical protein ENSA5_53710 [Enhygromyxa salina]|uniref:Uncharacterized protein n=1 Tax=Enhygromyxa salina TaxID=215803 RepID=A0A2S9XFM8_9BACT|nr:hypothetical protein [Enhygromyxa salina]PRP91662.1 hypothetical protein ENSA5_53710 [Enhygromyxa salina]